MSHTAPSTLAPPIPYNTDVVAFDNVSISFEDNHVLNNISFRVATGETRIILGPAGCGKSVLLKLVDGLLTPDSGSIHVFGQPVFHHGHAESDTALFAMREYIGMVFQESALFDSLSVRDNVGYRLDEQNVPRDEVDSRVEEALHFVEMGGTLSKFPSELSGGMRRRVAIARAIVSRPILLLYDSPTGGLDPITSTTIIELVVKQRDVRRTTSLLVTHRLQDAFALATNRFNSATGAMEPIPIDTNSAAADYGFDTGLNTSTKFLVLHEGRVVFDGDTRALLTSTDPWLKDFLT